MPGARAITKPVSPSSFTPPSTPPTPNSPPPTSVTRPPLSNRHQKEAKLAQTPTRSLYKTIVTIHVGSERQAFQVHRELLCHSSPFFAAAFDRDYNFSESSSDSLVFPEIRTIDFEFLVQWLYSHSLAHEELDVPKPAYFKLIRIYILADMLQIEALKNDVIDTIIILCEKWNSVPTANDTQLMDEQTMPKSALRRLVVDIFVHKKTDRLVEKSEDPWNPDFLREIFCELKRTQGTTQMAPFRDAKLKCQKYHEHKKTIQCVPSTKDETQPEDTRQTKPSSKSACS